MEKYKSSLPETVKLLIEKICVEQSQKPISPQAWESLAGLDEETAINILTEISSTRIYKTFSGFILFLVNKHANGCRSPFTSPGKRAWSPPSVSPLRSSNKKYGEAPMSKFRRNSVMPILREAETPNTNRQIVFEDETQPTMSLAAEKHESTIMAKFTKDSDQMIILNNLEYKKLFLVLSYTGWKKVEEVITIDDADAILSMNNLEMSIFESQIWYKYGQNYCVSSDRNQHCWDSAKPHLYYCYVNQEGYHFKGPYLDNTRTHLQRSLQDDNVLIVKFENGHYNIWKIAEEGIFVGLKHYQFFVFKDERKKKNNQIGKEKKSSVKCYFVHTEDENYAKSISSARCQFMHIHTVPTLEKYMARFSLILSRTVKLEVDFGAVQIITIEDIPFKDENGSIMHDEEGSILIHTDGTGFISEDLAMMCPKDFSSAMYMTDNNLQNHSEFVGVDGLPCQKRVAGARNNEPPLLMQCRLFYYGCAVKGTFLVNKKLGERTIQVRPSMIKVKRDETLPREESLNSLEIVNTSRKPGRCFLSKNLIALLSYGGVPDELFMNLLNDALDDSRNVFSNRRVALRAAFHHDGFDYGFIAQRMISSGIPLNEPYLQLCLSYLKDDKQKLKDGKIPIGESFLLMGTADPTGILENNQVSIIFDHGQISGKVLVYRHPGLHFGDIHVMYATPIKELEEYVGNSKFGIFFSTKGDKSAAYEMATGDFDGDLYWVSMNPQLLQHFKPSKPWERKHITKDSISKGLPDSPVELEQQLFQLLLEASSNQSHNMADANYSWQSYMDRLLTLGPDCSPEKEMLKKMMIHLIDIYYDALDAPKSGKNVHIPIELKAEMFPHYLKKLPDEIYKSTSILGKIHDCVDAFQDEVQIQEMWKLPSFDFPIPEEHKTLWRSRYDEYRKDMSRAMNSGPTMKNEAAIKVIKKYKQLLYDADEMEDTNKKTEQIYEEALAIYHVTYDHVIVNQKHDIQKCGFVWKVAGTALCNLYAWKMAGPKDRPFVMLPSVLRDLLN